MNCKEIRKLLQLYHDGELEQTERSKIESHLAECQTCQAELAELAALDDIIKDGEVEKIPDPGKHYWNNFTHRVTRRLAGHEEPIIKRRRVQPMKFRLIPYLSAGLAIILALVIAIPFLKNIPTRFTEEETMSMREMGNFKQEIAPGFKRVDELDADIDSETEPERLESRDTYYEISTEIVETEEVASLPAVSPEESSYPTSGMGGMADVTADKEGSEEKVLSKIEPVKETETGKNRGLFGILFPKTKSAARSETGSNQPETSDSQQETDGVASSDDRNQTKKPYEDGFAETETESLSTGKDGPSLPSHTLTDNAAAKLAAKGNNERIAGGQNQVSDPELMAGEKDFGLSQSGYYTYERQFVPRAGIPQPGTLKIVVDSIGQLVSVTIQQSSGDSQADASAVKAYQTRWQNRIFRQRSAFYVPFSKE